MKKLTDKKAWALIAEMGWGIRTEDYKHLSETYFNLLGKDGMQKLSDFVSAKVYELGKAVADYETLHARSLEVGSDDGFSDLRYHVVGMGKAEFDACMADPNKLAIRYSKREYTESFSYVFQEPELPRTKEQKQRSRELLAKNLAQLEKDIREIEFQMSNARGAFQDIMILLEQVMEDSKGEK